MSKRNSSIELLKIFAMLIITIFHVTLTVNLTKNDYFSQLPWALTYKKAQPGLEKMMILICRYLGIIGNHIFIVCSAWFLCRQDETKPRKIAGLYFNAMIISVAWLFAVSRLFPHVQISEKTIISCIFPVWKGENWFITCYVIVYFIHAGLNAMLKNISKEQHAIAVIVSFFIYCIIGIIEQRYYGNNLVIFITVYILVAYIRYHGKVSVKKGFLLLLIGLGGMIILVGQNVLKQPMLSKTRDVFYWAKEANPFGVIVALGLFEIANGFEFHNRLINLMSSVSIIYYLIHENTWVRNILRPLLWGYYSLHFERWSFPVRFMTFSAAFFAVSMIASLLYRLITRRAVGFLSGLSCKVSGKLWRLLYRNLLE